MRLYSCSGWAFDDSDTGQQFYRTKAEAMKAAREATAPSATVEGSDAEVRLHIAGPISASLIVAMLNHTGWCRHSETIAHVSNGRVKHEAEGDDVGRSEAIWQARMAGDMEA
jgi:hypothetical protein